ncbi:hypothetical protein O181_074546 [Austropuccinia psidii MF-1]|uniref:Mediator of RNA polymerase II transcription subunit 4 n=1 Tax=Austropuccinia psidii MF-1 TaxID=1389203 RepID=A0A9Q3FD25_9BASI|nr:hypothetical protein [Austropuccinia psidii MF-1]
MKKSSMIMLLQGNAKTTLELVLVILLESNPWIASTGLRCQPQIINLSLSKVRWEYSNYHQPIDRSPSNLDIGLLPSLEFTITIVGNLKILTNSSIHQLTSFRMSQSPLIQANLARSSHQSHPQTSDSSGSQSIPKSASRDQPLIYQFKTFLHLFNRITHSIFAQTSSPSFFQPNQPTPHQLLLQLDKSEKFLISLLKLQLEHDLNTKRILNLSSTISHIKNHLIQPKINHLYQAEKILKQICQDGQIDQNNFNQINSLALTPIHIMAYARLIAPYTSAPPAPSTGNQQQPINPTAGLDLQNPALRFIMPFPTEDVIRRGRMGQEMSATLIEDPRLIQNGVDMGHVLGQTRTADGARPAQPAQQMAYPTMPSRRPPPPPAEADDDLFDLDLNPDL